jgi:hypothetical protein
MYLLVQNKGVAPVESYTLLGVSTARDSGVEGVIGQFGSGAKHAVLVLLRAGIDLSIYCGKTKIKFHTVDTDINDGITTKTVKTVVAKLSGDSNRTVKLGWTLGFGALDWEEVEMALREFVSNAIDRTLREGTQVVDARDADELRVELVDGKNVRAQDGYTRVYVEATDEVTSYFKQLPTRFLQFSSDPLKNTKIQPKRGRNLTDTGKAVIYRNGVYVCELDGKNSLCDYNFSTSELRIDESRNLNDYVVRAAIAELYRNAGAQDLARVFRSVIDGEDSMEAGLDSYYLKNVYGSEARVNEQRTRWQEAWALAAGDGILCGDTVHAVQALTRKGYTPVAVANSAWKEAADFYGVPSAEKVLDSNEKLGRTETEATWAAKEAVTEVWEWVEMAGMSKGKQAPKVKGFDEATDGESECLGFYRPGGDTIWLRNDQGGAYLLETALEEIGHYVTGATDNSRDFQNFFMRIIVRLMAKVEA